LVRDRCRSVLLVAGSLLALGALPAACALEPFTVAGNTPDETNPTPTGSVGWELEVGAGITLLSVGYAITGNGFAKEGQVDLSQSPHLSAVIGGIPAGDGFVIIITATSPDGAVTCIGTAIFSVRDDMVTSVIIQLQCKRRPRIGKIDVTGEVNHCPVIDDLTATPIETGVGGTITLATKVVDPDGPTSGLDVTFGNGVTTLSQRGVRESAIALTCTAPGADRITLTISDGECLQTATVDVTCSGPAGGAPAAWVWQQLETIP
jgi:hypothetical protein